MSTTKNYGFEVIPKSTNITFGDFRSVLVGDANSNFTKLDELLAGMEISSMTVSGNILYLNKKDGTKISVTLPQVNTESSEGISSQEVFIATNSTTYEELDAALSAGKICFYKSSSYFYSFVRAYTTTTNGETISYKKFAIIDSNQVRTATCNSKSEWQTSTSSLQSSSFKSTTITSSSTDNYYPSCKAVYDFVTGLIGSFDAAAVKIDEIIGE